MAPHAQPVTIALLTCAQITVTQDGFVKNLNGLVHGRIADEVPFIIHGLWVY
jgi:hypothetical protein